MHDLSLIIPVFNEAKSLSILYDCIQETLNPIKSIWEVIFIDDGSRDDSFEVLKSLVEKDPEHVRVIAFRRNFGQTAAITAGIDHANGEIIVLLDADLQNDPADIPMLLAKLDEGYDLVSGWRKDRKDNRLTRTIPSNIANGLISWVTGVHLHDYGCTLKAYRREALKGFRLYGEMHRFIPVFAHSVGARIAEIPVHHHERKFGKANYGLDRTMKIVLDLFTVKFLLSYSHKPMRLFGGVGMVLFSGGGLLLLYLFIRRMLENISVLGSPLFQLAIMFLILGSQSILMGLIAELLARTYHESQSKPTYTIRTVLGKK
ncbi:MAG TPA: glycosyltransferase family 2 protein [Anaerolineales bacterium]|nr:glycosyltransferase family 2 protein [Anaerolineales bacterium]HLO29629.1 glycosyltransferase family 2 protein [Anaerolineales bacterium]